MSARITVTHDVDSIEVRSLGRETVHIGVDVTATVTYRPGEHGQALEAVDHMAADLRRQIADAAERASDD